MLYQGRQPTPPDFILGYQQSKLRYFNQSQVLDVAQRFHDENVNVSLIVVGKSPGYSHYSIDLSLVSIDFFAWKFQGDWWVLKHHPWNAVFIGWGDCDKVIRPRVLPGSRGYGFRSQTSYWCRNDGVPMAQCRRFICQLPYVAGKWFIGHNKRWSRDTRFLLRSLHSSWLEYRYLNN